MKKNSLLGNIIIFSKNNFKSPIDKQNIIDCSKETSLIEKELLSNYK